MTFLNTTVHWSSHRQAHRMTLLSFAVEVREAIPLWYGCSLFEVDGHQLVLDGPDNRCLVWRFRRFLHHAEPVEFPLSLGHKSLASAELVVTVTQVSWAGPLNRYSALQLELYFVHVESPITLKYWVVPDLPGREHLVRPSTSV